MGRTVRSFACFLLLVLPGLLGSGASDQESEAARLARRVQNDMLPAWGRREDLAALLDRAGSRDLPCLFEAVREIARRHDDLAIQCEMMVCAVAAISPEAWRAACAGWTCSLFSAGSSTTAATR
ncbi:MAG: hypothetical protein JXQ29_08865 [Planctomycetes bacterium]|nr:hypothetical protein [Planctomycetota bacterium]